MGVWHCRIVRLLMLKRVSGVSTLSRRVVVRRVGLSGFVALRAVQQPAVIVAHVLMRKSWKGCARKQSSRLMVMTRRRVLQLNFCVPSPGVFAREIARW
ncbi:hypothetical protein GCM10028828_20500 [Corynebacterium tapiri]